MLFRSNDTATTEIYTLSLHDALPISRRRYLALNVLNTATIQTGMVTWARLHDVILLTRQKAKDGPQLASVPFYVNAITYSFDLERQHWTTQLQASEITTFNIGPILTPPFPPPTS